MDTLAMNEELLILRLPSRLAARIGARIDRQDRARGDQSSLLRRRRKQKGGKNDKSEVAAFVNAVWGEDGAPDYDSLSDVEDLLDLDGLQEDEGSGSDDDKKQDNRDDKEKETEDFEHEDCAVEYWRVEGNNFIFKYGEDEYYATLVSLPCVVEAQKTTDTANVYKTADIGSMLIVHDVKTSSGLPRPELDPNDTYNGSWAHGITPPMRRVLPDRFAKVSSAARREEHNLTSADVQQADERLFEFKELVLQMHKKVEAPPVTSKKKASLAPVVTSTIFAHEELIDAEPWMEYADDVIIVELGDDKFRSSTRAEHQKAKNNKSELESKRNKAAGVRSFPAIGGAAGSFSLLGPMGAPVRTSLAPTGVPQRLPGSPVPLAGSPPFASGVVAPAPTSAAVITGSSAAQPPIDGGQPGGNIGQPNMRGF